MMYLVIWNLLRIDPAIVQPNLPQTGKARIGWVSDCNASGKRTKNAVSSGFGIVFPSKPNNSVVTVSHFMEFELRISPMDPWVTPEVLMSAEISTVLVEVSEDQ